MSFEIYASDFSTRYELSHATSIQMSYHYNSTGTIQLVVPIDDYNIKALRKNAVVYDTTSGQTYIIVNTKCDTKANRITANGYTAEWLLNKRVVSVKHPIINIEKGVYSTVSGEMRGLSRITTAAIKGLTPTMSDTTIYGGQLLDEITQLLGYGSLGRRMNWSDANKAWEFEVYQGRDLTGGIHAVAFVEEQGTCSDLVINTDVSTLKNVIAVPYTLKDETEDFVVVGTAQGNDRYELWSAKTVSQDSEETVDECKARARAEGALELQDYISRQSFNVAIDASELGTRYNVGDIVACVSVRFGVSFYARITGVKYTLDINGETTEIVLGDPLLNVIGGIRLGKNK